MVASPEAVLDACVLFPAALRDTLLRAAAAGLYRLYWSDQLLEELRRSLVESGRTTEEGAQRLVAVMRRAFPDAAGIRYEHLLGRVTNHPGDRHVLALAAAVKASVIVTFNLAHFARPALEPFGVVAQTPDEFLTYLFGLDPDVVARVVVEQAADLRSPPASPGDVLARLARDAPGFAAIGAMHLARLGWDECAARRPGPSRREQRGP